MNTLLLSILISAIFPGEESGCIQGHVHDYYGVPMIGATVLISGTSQGAMTDTTAYYFISDVSPGIYEITAQIMVMGQEKDTVTVTPGDTIDVDFILASGLQYLPDISWKFNQETYPDTVVIIVEEPLDLDLALSQVWVADELMPSWSINNSTIVTALPELTDSFHLWVFPLHDVLLERSGFHDTISISLAPIEEDGDGLSFQSLSGSHILIDITEWGNPDLINWGFMSSRVFYDDNGSMKMLLVYNERAVLIDQVGNIRIFDFPFPTFHYRTDPGGEYLLIWDICGRQAVGGDAAIMSMEEGSFHVFDPSPEKEIPDRGYYSIGTVLASIWVSDWGMYHLTSSGDFVRLTGADFRKYNSYGELLQIQSIEELGLNDNHYALQFLSFDQEAVSGIYNDDSLNYCFTIDFDGNLVFQSTIPYPVEHPVLRTSSVSDGNSAVLWVNSDRYGLARVDCRNGDFLYMPDVSITNIKTSQNSTYLGVTAYPDNDRTYCEHDVRNWSTGDVVYSIREDNPSGVYSQIEALSDTGLSLISSAVTGGSSERVYSVCNQEGEVVWTFKNAPPAGTQNTEATMSPTGSIVTIPYGRYIDVVILGDLE